MSKQLFKRSLSTLLALVMVISVIPMSVWAVEGETKETHAVVNNAVTIDGVTISADSNGTMTAVNGVVTVTVDGGNRGKTTCITVKNSADTAVMVSFGYKVSNAYDWTLTESTFGNFNVVLQKDAEHTFTMKAAMETTATVELSNIKVAALTSDATLSLSYDSNLGTVKQGSTTVTSGTKFASDVTNGITLTATPKEGMSFSGWINTKTNELISQEATYTFYLTGDLDVRAEFATPMDEAKFTVTGDSTLYTLQEALEIAKNRESTSTRMTIVLASSGVVEEGTYDFPKNTTLKIPCAEGDGSPNYSSTASSVSREAYRILKLAPGAILNFNSSCYLYVYGTVSTKTGPGSGLCVGDYGCIELSAGSKINMKSDSKLYCYGYITGQGDVVAESGSTAYEIMQITGWRGGSITEAWYNAGSNVSSFAFNDYAIQNVEANFVIKSGATVKAKAVISASYEGSVYTQEVDLPYIGTTGEELFALDKNDPNASICRKMDPATGRMKYTFNGNVGIKSIYLAIDIMGFYDLVVDSETKNLAIPYYMDFVVADGAKLTMDNRYKMMPGSSILVEEGGELVVGAEVNGVLNLYNTDDYVGKGYGEGGKDYSPVMYVATAGAPIPTMDKNTPNAKLTINGKLSILRNGAICVTSSSITNASDMICGSGTIESVATRLAWDLNEFTTSGTTISVKNIGVHPVVNSPGTYKVSELYRGMSFSSSSAKYPALPLKSAPVTVEAWIMLEKGYNGRPGIIWGNYQSEPNPYISFEVIAGGIPKLELAKSWSDTGDTMVSLQFDNVNVATGEWLHLAITYDASKGEAYCYVNGVSVQTINKSIDLSILQAAMSSNNPMVLGGDHRSGNAQYFKGKIASLAVYADQRTEGEIKADMEKPGADNLIVHYELEPGMDKIADLSGNGYGINICEHTMDVEFTWAPDYSSATAKYTCTKCGETGTASCKVEGKGGRYRASVTINRHEYTDAKTDPTAFEGTGFTAGNKLETNQTLKDVPVTFEAWVNIPQTQTGRVGIIWGNFQPNGKYISFEVVAGGIPKLQRGDLDKDENVRKIEFDQVHLNTGEWTHVAITYSGNTGYCYVNGVLKQTVTAVNASNTKITDFNFADYAVGSDYPMVLGGDQRDGNAQYFKGKIASLAVYSDKRTEDEIKADMLQPGKDALILHYELEDGKTVIEDLSGKGYHIGMCVPTIGEFTWNANNTATVTHQCKFCGNVENTLNCTVTEVKGKGYIASVTVGGVVFSDIKFNDTLGKNFDENTKLETNQTLKDVPVTFEAWIKVDPTDVSTDGRTGIIWGSYQIDANPYISFEIYEDGHPKLEFAKSWSGTGEGMVSLLFDQVNVATGKWLHLAITYDASKGEAYCYVNGALKQTITKSIDTSILQAAMSSNNPMVLGGDHRTTNNRFFRGEIASLAVYSDQRTVDEIVADMVEPGKEDLILHYELEDGKTVIEDLSGKGYHIGMCDHDYQAVYTWADDYSTATASYKCLHCSNVTESETVTSIKTVIRAATCIHSGIFTFTADFTKAWASDQEIQVETNTVGHAQEGYCDICKKNISFVSIPLGDFNSNGDQKTLIAVPFRGAVLTIKVNEGYQVMVHSGNNHGVINMSSGWLGNGDTYELPRTSIYMYISLKAVSGAAASKEAAGVIVTYESSSNALLDNDDVIEKIKGSENLSVLIHMTDIHGDVIRADRAMQFAAKVGAHAVMVSGDLTAYAPSHWGSALFDVFRNYKVPYVYTVGNHDAYGKNASELHDLYYNQLENGKTYYYQDIAGQKLRIISVNQFDHATNSNGSCNDRTGYSQAQINWLITTLQNTPAGYGVLLVYHSPETSLGNTPTENYEEFYQTSGNRYDTSTTKSESILYKLVDAFMQKGTLNTQIGEISLNADFTNVANGVEFIAHVTGHMHHDSITYAKGTACKQLLLNSTCTTAMYGAQGGYGYLADKSDLLRGNDDASQDAFNAYVIDRENKTIRVLRVGAKETTDGTTRDDMTIPYADAFTVKFVDEDGTVLQSGKVTAGETPVFNGKTPTKAATAEYTYTFAGWTPEVSPVTGEVIYKATYKATKNTYTITWNVDGEKITETYEYGATPSITAPSKNGHTFAGWSPVVGAVTGDAEYTAQWTVNQFTITFVTDGGSEIAAITQNYGTAVTAPNAPTKDGYHFVGWDKEIPATMPAENVTITAIWEAHVDESPKDHKCDICDEVMSQCADSDDADHSCDICGKENISTHSYTSEVTKAPTCTTAGEMTYTCSECGDSYTEEIAATGEHADSNNDHSCDVCGNAVSVCADSDVDGKCDVCGELFIHDAPNIMFFTTSLSFQEYIGLQFIAKQSVFADYDSFYAVIVQTKPNVDKGTVTGFIEESIQIVGYASGTANNPTYVFNKDIQAWSMTDTVTITLYAVKDGVTYRGETRTTSVMEQAYIKLGQFAGNDQYAPHCKILADMLTYGAAVQVAFDHDALDLPNAKLEELGYSSFVTSTIPNVSAENTVSGTGSMTVRSTSLSLQQKVDLQLIFKGDMTGYKAVVTLEGGEPFEVYPDGNMKKFSLVSLPYKMRDTYTVVICDAETGEPVSPTYTYSVESVAKTKLGSSEAFDKLIYAMLNYGDSVRAIVK